MYHLKEMQEDICTFSSSYPGHVYSWRYHRQKMILKQKGCYLDVFGQQFTQFPEFTGSKPEPVSFSDVPRQFRHRPAEGDNGQQLLPENLSINGHDPSNRICCTVKWNIHTGA